MRSFLTTTALAGAVSIAGAGVASATVFDGNLFYTLFSGSPNVWTVPFSYDDSIGGSAGLTLSAGSATSIVGAPGADGIIFAPSGNLLIGGQGTNRVFEYQTSGAAVTSTLINTNSYHLTLDPALNKVYTSAFGGPLQTLGINGAGHLDGTFTTTAVSGNDTGVTQIAFGGGNVYYVNGSPNGFGNVGLINLTTGNTIRFYSGVESAHGMVFDPFTGLMTLFGAGKTGTFNPDATASGLKQSAGDFACDFDQGAVDGFGHALVAGCNSLTFLDYSTSHDITNPDFVVVRTGFNNIDDVAPLVGPGSVPIPTPEPASMAILGIGLGALGWLRRRRS